MGDFHTQPEIGDTLNALLLIEHGCAEGLATRAANDYGDKCRQIATLQARVEEQQKICDSYAEENQRFHDRVEELTKALEHARAFLNPDSDPPRISNRAMVRVIDKALALPMEGRGGAT